MPTWLIIVLVVLLVVVVLLVIGLRTTGYADLSMGEIEEKEYRSDDAWGPGPGNGGSYGEDGGSDESDIGQQQQQQAQQPQQQQPPGGSQQPPLSAGRAPEEEEREWKWDPTRSRLPFPADSERDYLDGAPKRDKRPRRRWLRRRNRHHRHEPSKSEPPEFLGEESLEAPVSYPLLEAPDSVVAGEEFTLAIGLAAKPAESLLDHEPITLPPDTGPRYHLVVHVTAVGFAIREGESWRHTLFVDWEDQPYPSTAIHLTPDPLSSDVAEARFVKASYEIDGNTVAVAARAMAVVAEPVSPLPEMPASRFSDVHIPIGPAPPDLTIRLFRGLEEDQLWMTFGSPNEELELPDEELEVNVGSSSEEFTRQLVDSMNLTEGSPAMWNTLLGAGRRIGRALKGRTEERGFWEILDEVSEGVSTGIPSVLLLSEEPYVPWELASEPDGAPNPERPFLSQRSAIGRWPLDTERLPPPHAKSVGPMAVVSGEFVGIPYWDPLEHAVKEAADMQAIYAAMPVDATYEAVRKAIEGDPPRDLLHMAIHGKYDADNIDNGLILINHEDSEHVTLTPNAINGMDVPGEPFVFLNACQVGNNSEVLGLYGGVSAAFLDRGATAVVAPLWNVKDDRARTLALGFYQEVLAGTPVGEALRRGRAQFGPGSDTSTFMAYQYFGHPRLQISKR